MTRQRNTYPKWFTSRIFMHDGTVDKLPDLVPSFERRAFGLTQTDRSGKEQTRLNGNLDMIVRKPYKDHENYVPVGVVSKDYTLVSHHEVIAKALNAFGKADIHDPEIRFEMRITENGERMALSLFLPDKFAFDPGDGDKMALRLECINSVDGSTRFQAVMGWFRFVCSNGLIIGTTLLDLNKRHNRNLSIESMDQILSDGIRKAGEDAENLIKWRKFKVEDNILQSWVLQELRSAWGFKAASRAWHISRSGSDVTLKGSYKDHNPISMPVEYKAHVPGSPKRSDNLYDISQVLSWLAKERRDISEQISMRAQIPGLMESLQKNCGAASHSPDLFS